MYTLFKDIRYGFRVLRRSPGFSLIALMTLVLGIGANTLIFTIVSALSFHGPFKDADNLVIIRNQYPNVAPMSTSLPDFQTWRDQTHSFSKMAGYWLTTYTFSGKNEPKRVRGALITRNYFELFGTSSYLGRFFVDSEQTKGGPPVCLISEQLWRQEFDADLSIFSKSINLDGKPYQIVGIVPAEAPDFRSYPKTEVWLPLEAAPPWEAENINFIWTIGKLKPNATIESAREDLKTIQYELNAQNPDNKHAVNVVAVSDFLLGSAKRALTVLLIAVAFVLLIACANVANMLLARATARTKEIAVREALGANRWRLVRQLLTENVILTSLATMVALGLAYLCSTAMLEMWPSTLRRPEAVEIDWRVLVFTASVACLSTMLFGLAPALRMSRINVNRTLRESQGLQTTAGPTGYLLRNGFVVSEIAFATVLLIASVFTLRSFVHMLEIDHGFSSKDLLTFRIALPERKYATNDQRRQFFEEALNRLRLLPGVTSAAATSFLPLSSGQTAVFDVKGHVYDPAQRPWAERHFVSSDYFDTMKIPLVQGRYLTTQDRDTSVKTVVVSQTMAKQIWPGEDPIGKYISFNANGDKNEWQEVVGVVGDIRGNNVEAAPPMQIYISMLQYPTAGMTVILHSRTSFRSMVDSAKATVLGIDPDQPLANIATMDEVLDNSISGARYSTFLLGLFASLAMTLAVLGVYGVMAYSVTQRSHEFGIRIALGAQRSSIMRMVMGAGVRLVVFGTAAGLVLSFLVAPFLRSLLFDDSVKSSTDISTYGIVVVLLTLGAIMASYLPAYRATKADPMMLLRHD
jgi:putative ABC transport system permease protein